MIFRPELVKLIQRGAKTATRRKAKGNDPARYKAGATVAVCPGRGKAQVCRIHITQVERQLVGDLTQHDAIAEGFKTRADFADYWMRLYDLPYLKANEDRPEDDVIFDRFTTRHANTPVWAITFHLDTAHRPVLMHKHSERGYTDIPHNALQDEPEAIDASLLKHYTEDAKERFLNQPGRREEHIRRRMKAMSERAKRLGAQGIALPDDVIDTIDQLDSHLEILERQRAA